jgi:hypothetical protein
MNLLLINISGNTILIIMLVILSIVTIYGFLPNEDDVIEEKSYSTDEEINTDISEEGIADFKKKYNLQDDNDIIFEASNN